jgi:sialate O-acetylesterase
MFLHQLPIFRNKTFSLILLIGLFALTSVGSHARVRLPAVFSDHMVLQQNTRVAIWGWAEPSEKGIRIVGSWNPKDTVVVNASNGAAWSAMLPTGAAGGPYTLTVLGSSKVELKNVLLGEVWVCSGQSNMEWSVNAGVIGSEAEVPKANQPNIRIFQIPRLSAAYPQQDCPATWTECTPETMRSTSAIGYFFAKEVQQKMNVPVGIIVSAWGGSIIDDWYRKELFEADKELQSVFVGEQVPWAPSEAGVIYNAMIAPIVPYGIAGALWYQGEANVSKPQSYAHQMRVLIEGWRKDFGRDFPFYYIQIAPFTYGDTPAYLLREQQAKALSIPKTGMVVVSDLVENVKDIHPKNKIDVGKRLANLALADTYGQKMANPYSPMYKSMKVEGNKVRLTFDHAEGGLKSNGKSIGPFQIGGEDRRFVDAQAQMKGNEVVVWSKEVKKPVAVRFNFDNASTPNLFSREGLPVAPFRTDDWEVK